MNIAIGAIDRLGSLFTMALLYIVLQYVHRHFAFFTISSVWYQWVVGYIVVDFISYWVHRFSHQINILWAGHITHHSSLYFNLSNSFRTSFFQGFNRILFWAALPLLGFSPLILITLFTISGIYDFFMHTPYFTKNILLEKLFITPSLHKVHHGKNDIYINKNYGSTFSIWDRMFNTFAEETEEVEFGITDDYKDLDPVKAITYYYSYLIDSLRGHLGIKKILNTLFAHPYSKIIEHTPESLVNLKPVAFYSRLWYFAIFDLLFGTIIDFFALVYRDRLSNWYFVLIYLIGLVAIITSVRLLNGLSGIRNWKQIKIYLFVTFVVLISIASMFHEIFFV